MPGKPAQQVEIIRANQKDEFYLAYIQGSLADLTTAWFGAGQWFLWRREVQLAADLGYFLLTTVSGLQTLGEEYVNMVQVDPTGRAVPSTLRRVMLVLLHVVTPYAFDKWLQHCEKTLKENWELGLRPEARQHLLQVIPVLRHLVTMAHRLHLVVFYMRGIFYHLAKRLTHITYILVHGGPDADRGGNYRILGWLSVIQLGFMLVQQLYRTLTSKTASKAHQFMQDHLSIKSNRNESSNLIRAEEKCPLCLEARNRSTATPCGHVFCWSCISEWCENKAQCPLCREPFPMSRLIFLQNF